VLLNTREKCGEVPAPWEQPLPFLIHLPGGRVAPQTFLDVADADQLPGLVTISPLLLTPLQFPIQ
jgi:hypothetical protein